MIGYWKQILAQFPGLKLGFSVSLKTMMMTLAYICKCKLKKHSLGWIWLVPLSIVLEFLFCFIWFLEPLKVDVMVSWRDKCMLSSVLGYIPQLMVNWDLFSFFNFLICKLTGLDLIFKIASIQYELGLGSLRWDLFRTVKNSMYGSNLSSEANWITYYLWKEAVLPKYKLVWW